ncbi:hypothetical protein Anapl_10823 [Anas platyrhynchos]|uniref:Uncharacterized protein n=1 Tax=Anas platyrhynchos TaxID=8839 RepID=R0L8T2_ANAPL|nr:hypothetical protein Anapl_10823 [Anas platyrhynchos]
MVCADEWVIHKEQHGPGPSVDQTAQIESLKRESFYLILSRVPPLGQLRSITVSTGSSQLTKVPATVTQMTSPLNINWLLQHGSRTVISIPPEEDPVTDENYVLWRATYLKFFVEINHQCLRVYSMLGLPSVSHEAPSSQELSPLCPDFCVSVQQRPWPFVCLCVKKRKRHANDQGLDPPCAYVELSIFLAAGVPKNPLLSKSQRMQEPSSRSHFSILCAWRHPHNLLAAVLHSGNSHPGTAGTDRDRPTQSPTQV